MSFDFNVELYRSDWAKFYWKSGLERIPGIIIPLFLGLCLHQVSAGVLAASTAFSVGFAGSRQIRESRLLAMIVTTLLMSFSAFTGTLAGNWLVTGILVTGLWGFACGLLTVVIEDIGWIVMQGTIALLIATSFPGLGLNASLRALFVLVGGAIQTISLILIWRMNRTSWSGPEFSPVKASHPQPIQWSGLWTSFTQAMIPSSASFHYALRVALTLVIAIGTDHLLHLKNGYWLPMTTLIVLKPDFYRTYTGGIQRVTGTLTGVISATVIAAAFHPQNLVMVLLVGFFAFYAYALQKTNPVLFSAALTSFVVFLIALTGLPESSVTGHRLVNTSLGCLLAMLSRFIGYKLWQRWVLDKLKDQPPIHRLL